MSIDVITAKIICDKGKVESKKLFWQQDVQLYHQILYARFSIEKIDINSKKNSFEGIFYYIQTMLDCVANISKMLLHDDYADHLNIERSNIPHLMHREIRNYYEHIDRRLDNDFCKYVTWSDMGMGEIETFREKPAGTLRWYDKEKRIVAFCENESVIELPLEDVCRELEYITGTENMKYIFDRYKNSNKIF